MISFRHLFGIARDLDRRHLDEALEVYRRCFPYAPEYADTIRDWIEKPHGPGVEPVMLVAVGPGGRVKGFSLALLFPDLKYAYLDYVASDPAHASRGIGGALYEATREMLRLKGVKGMFLDVPHDDPALLKEPGRAPVNARRLRFYARYGALPIEGTLYDRTPTAANEGYVTHLVFDGLGHVRPLRAATLRKVVRAIFGRKYRLDPEAPDIRRIVASCTADPVALRQPLKPPPPAQPKGRLRPITLVTAERHALHHLKEKGYVERPVRMDAVLRGISGLPVRRVRAQRFGEAPIRRVHAPALVGYLARASARLAPRALIYPTVFPLRKKARPPRAFEMRAGYYCIDTFTPLSAASYKAARGAVDCALTATRVLEGGERFVYALCRPPGHHAERNAWGGFCYFNNAAVAAHRLSAQGKVALLDIDHHHGNGTQDIFYERADVLVVNIHGHPDNAYPYFSGFPDERGAGPGLGCNRNIPLQPGADDARYLRALDDALAAVRRFGPDWFVVSVGYDIMKGDPTGTFAVTARGMREIGRRLGALGLPTLLVQEGGYSLHNLRFGAHGLLTGLLETW